MESKPRVLINMHYMEIGGAERALLGLLDAINTDKVSVDLFINQHTGEFMKYIPSKINLLPENRRYSTLERPIIDIVKEGHIDIAFARILAKMHHWLQKNLGRKKSDKPDYTIFQLVAQYTTPLLPSLHKLGQYDLAVSFLTPHNIIARKVLAKKKIAWIHTDYSTISINPKMELPIWSCFDKIISISDDVSTAFLQQFPTLNDRIYLIENIVSANLIKEQANEFEPIEYESSIINICSIGRFCEPKNFNSIPFIAQHLQKRGLKFKWFIIGFGDDSTIKHNIKATDTSEYVTILGKKPNPYPYISECDIYVQPSLYEGKSVAVREAQALNKPVIITNYPTSSSQVNNGVDGIICSMDNESIASAIYELAMDKGKQELLTQNLTCQNDQPNSEIDKFYSLI